MPRKRLSDFAQLKKSELIATVKSVAGLTESQSLLVVAARAIEIPEFSCSLSLQSNEDVHAYVRKWTSKYLNGYNNRPSQRKSNPIGTQHDPILDDIIAARIQDSSQDLAAIKYGHRLSMSAENIAGALLEEFVATQLLAFGWHCCWGETMKSIDFCHEDGGLLQVKNSDNSENSSSKTVRDGTNIQHWFRRYSRTGKTNWPALNELANIKDKRSNLTEDAFRMFVRKVVSNNPDALYVEETSPFYGTQN